MAKRIVIVGAGPAGLTAAAELIEHGHRVVVLEKDPEYVGGIARTAHYKGYRFDIGGHRFFSKSDEVTKWWQKRLPNDFIKVNRLSRIFYNSKFFDYPLKAFNALFGLGVWTSTLCVLSYVKARIVPIQPEKSFADWVSNRFGKRLFNIFFKTYTEKVWGTPCDQISADWAAQRIKGLSLLNAIWNAIVPKRKGDTKIKTLIDQFEYPRLGPGQMWEKTRDDIRQSGNQVLLGMNVVRIHRDGNRVLSVVTRDAAKNETEWAADEFIISMPLRETVRAIVPSLGQGAQDAANKLAYRDFLTVALMVKKANLFPDNWIYVHDPGVKLGRIQNFNNWSPEMVPGENVTCLGLEYFCFENDELWSMSDADLVALGTRELAQLGLVNAADVFDGAVVRMPKAYPIYDPDYNQTVETLKNAIGELENLQVVGRNGMHKYNNQDHSMMTALLAARNIDGAKYNLWQVNTDAEYHEAGESKELVK